MQRAKLADGEARVQSRAHRDGASTVMARPRFGLLGPMLVSIDGTSTALGGPKQRAVLATLLINRNRPVSIETLTAAAWDDEPPAEARANIHVYVSNLRRLLAAPRAQAYISLEKSSVGYQLDVDDTDVDAGRFLQGNANGMRAAAARRYDEATKHLSAALDEWRGPVLEDLRHLRFTETFAVAMMEHKIAAHTALAQSEIACGRAESVIGGLETVVAEHPYREPVWAQLMTAYYVVGRQFDALDSYRRLAAVLADDLGIDPNTTLRELYARMLRQEPLDVAHAPQATAQETIGSSSQHKGLSIPRLAAWLHTASGHRHPVMGAATSIGRLSDNHIVLTDAKVSRRHAVIVDTGVGYVIHDRASANGIEVNRRRVIGSATLADGDHLCIGDLEFVFKVDTDD